MILDIDGIKVLESKPNYGTNYKFDDTRGNEINLDLTELTMDDFYYFSIDMDDFEEYEIIKDYDVEDIVGYDWDIKLNGNKANVRLIFNTIEKIGKRYTGIYYPNIMYYRYTDDRMHRHYRDWIKFMGYELVFEKNLAVYYREKT